ncbi:ATP-binding cassette domain-containing protein [Bacillus solitudinis]|uniref:ATP-binding cassette domain-containing protein n=1 Tax=Bacillus solitudinis TaxID=2014074 RepID=UPI000C2463C9|nr:ABC transporter ATP-binding protein [Bacillus solitudinis]
MTEQKDIILRVDQIGIAHQHTQLVNDVSFQVNRGEIVALTGPSGCGKSLTAQAIVGLLDPGMRVTNGTIYYKECNVLKNSREMWQQLRREEVSLLIQDSINGLNPIQTIRKQMIETLKLKKKLKKGEVNTYFNALLSEVGFEDPEQILSSYSFELSGGMRQRVLIAMMLSLEPKLLIADEPTTALDFINREKVLSLLQKLQRAYELSIVLISHDQRRIKKFADRVFLMSQGGTVS